MINAAIFIGNPISFQGKFNVYPPTVGEVLMPQFPLYQKLVLMSDDDILETLKDHEGQRPSPFQFLMINSARNPRFLKLAETALEQFVKQKVTILLEKQVIIIGDLKETIDNASSIEELPLLKEDNYFDFQNCAREVMGLPHEEKFEDDPNLDPRIKKMKEKARLRDRIKAKKGSSSSISMTTALASLCCRGIGLTPTNIRDIPYASINILMGMSGKKEKYEIDIRSLQAGADKKKIHPTYWISDKE